MATTCPSNFDLTTEAGVEAYLTATPYACTEAKALSGGMTNFVFRLHLRQPHESKNTLVLKHGRPYIKDLSTIPFDVKRQAFEVEAFKRIRKWSPQAAFVTVPNAYLYDEVERVIIMDDCGSNSVTLKEYMQSGRCSVETAHQIGQEVGNFIGHLHTWGKANPEVYEFFEQNQQGEIMSGCDYYGRLLPTFDGGLEKLRDPDVVPSEMERRALEKIVEETGDAVRKVTGNFIMGDFWPGNLVLSFDEAGKVSQIRILDWEVCRPGLFGCELGQFCAELVLLQRFNGNVCGNTAQFMLEDFLKTYTNHITPNLELCRRAIVHLGTHLVTLTPTIEWGGKAKTQEVVKEGMMLILDGYGAERDWLEKSVIGPLVKSVT